MQGQQVTIFGGTGFLGRYMIKRLADLGAVVKVAVRHPEEAKFLQPLGNVGQIAPVVVNIASDESVARAVTGSVTVINCIGVLYQKGKQKFEFLHVAVAERIAKVSKEASVRNLLHVSALGADSSSSSAYARSKAAGEKAVLAIFRDAIILRPSIVFGAEDKFFNLFAGLAQISLALPLIGGGHTKFQPVYVCDVASAAIAALQNPDARGKVFELGGPQVYSFKELLAYILKEIRLMRLLLPIPFKLAKIPAFFLELLPKPLLTRDQVELLKKNNVVSAGAHTLADLGVSPTAVEAIMPAYLVKYRKGGQFTTYQAE